ncbi:MAG: RraA family protein [Chloroflexia bacterium]|nr:RraA family protein [Chloroflexia bacterium]
MASSSDPYRLPEAHLAYLRGVDSPTLANAIETFEVRDRTEGFIGGTVRSMFPDLGVMVGQAVTVTVANDPGPVAGREGFWEMWEALEAAPHPAVLVIADASGAPSRCAYFGEVMATFATRLGAVGLVTDGGVRDLAEVRALGLHFFAPFPVVSHGNFHVASVGEPVTLDGQVIRPGDILHGDANGVVIVPTEVLDGLPAAIEDILAKEAETMERIRAEGFRLADIRPSSGY